MSTTDSLVPNPFNRQDYQELQLTKRLIHDLLPAMDKAERCGTECSQLRQVVEGMRQRLEAIEREYFSGSEFQ